MNEQHIILYANCIPVKGQSKSAIYDLQRNKIIDIPNDLYDFTHFFDTHNVSELYELGGAENYETVHEYIQFLIEEEVAFLVDKGQQKLFPTLDMIWDYPSQITNMILEISDLTFPVLNKIVEGIISLGCEHLYIRIRMEDPIEVLRTILHLLETAPVYSIVFEVELGVHQKIKNYETLIDNNNRVDTLFLLTNEIKKTNSKKIIFSTPKDFITRKERFFRVNISLFTEAQGHNVYFNRKLYIDQEGTIKNAPETKETFGKITDVSNDELYDIIKSPSFQKYWEINKDLITECKTCEYRYMCIDNRLPVLRENRTYSFETECKIKAVHTIED
ncbi:grasp-with-spasm system SPASM domain peptide maturase [Aquimarina sp. TRL1]|uniref:grasp-with-spasm system SPASM domain peptide maturase n=1 Tax=Aquimarina sp. (strain TRL1) TaxID=2736252 RepID=UPI00158C4BEC|nr:grasp-with-spasm system SPASM domain peptide maturase [Aquimarina sp. TRL1]QKX04218.1 grasp-with-spasm system SPASM domain peptide maturase [Aquimarina sp. TRL1]